VSNELKASNVAWRKLRRVLITSALVIGACSLAVHALWGGSVLLNADGLVTSSSVAVASPWQDARVREIRVRPGDWVEAGQKIAVVDSAAMSRSLADLAAEKARMGARLAQLEARKTYVKTLLPLATASNAQTQAFVETLEKAEANGLVRNRTLQEMMTARVQASERLFSLQAEQSSLDVEVGATQDAFNQVSAAYADLQRTYNGGVLQASVSGHVGSKVAMVGEVLSASKDEVARLHTGTSFALAYIPEGYLFELEEGQMVAVKARGQVVPGHIERVLPVTEALPPEFQLPNKVRGRGQLVRVTLSPQHRFAVAEKIQVTGCYLENCRMGLSDIIRQALPHLREVGSKIAHSLTHVKSLVGDLLGSPPEAFAAGGEPREPQRRAPLAAERTDAQVLRSTEMAATSP